MRQIPKEEVIKTLNIFYLDEKGVIGKKAIVFAASSIWFLFMSL